MSLFRKIILCLIPLFFLGMSSVSAGEVTETVKSTIDRVITILNDPELKKTENISKRKSALHALLKESFDEVEFARRSLMSHWDRLTDDEKKSFAEVFSNLLETTYFDKIDDYMREAKNFSAENIVYLEEKVKGRFAVVKTQVNIGNNGTIPVDYRMINKNQQWVVCDLVIEGVSIVKNYRAQFNEILANSSFQELLQRLQTKKS